MMVNVGQKPTSRKSKVTEHPSIEELVMYRSGGLKPDEEEVICDHLARCQEAAEEYLGLVRFEEEQPLSEELRLCDDAMADDFDLFVVQLSLEDVNNVVQFQRRPLWAAAAMFVIALGASVWYAIGRPSVLSEPILNVHVIDLYSTEDAAAINHKP